MASTYRTILGTVTFTATTDGWSESSESDVDVIGFPGGDAIAISIGGQRETRRAFKAILSSAADYRTLRAMRGKEGWLYVENWDAGEVQAVLIGTSPDPPWESGEVTATTRFLLY